MPQPPDLADQDRDEGTWQHPTQSAPPDPRPENRLPDQQSAASHDEITPRVDTLFPAIMPKPSGSPGSRDSADSDGVTPKPGSERSDEWDVLPPPVIEKGQVIFGKYLLQKKIGEGGMGEVWLVENIQLERQSALKLIKQEIAQNKKGWSRFEREARLMAKLTHRNAVAVYDFKRSHSIGYIEMEFVRGHSLDKFLAEYKGQPMSLAWTAQFLEQLCSLLQEAHGYVDEKRGKSKPIIHRDLKPSNLMLVDKKPPGQNLKVLDFGIAKMIEDDGSPELTGAGDLVGTPAYMSPEQIRGGMTKEGNGEIDGRSDLYSVGVLLYQLLTGYLPFKGMHKMAVLAAHLNLQPPSMKETNPDARVPAQVERVVMSCLEKDPDRRPRTARELAEKFQAAVGAAEIEVQPIFPWTKAVLIAAGCVLIAGMTWVGPKLYKSLDRGKTFEISKVKPEKGTAEGGEVRPPMSTRWQKYGYETLSADQLEDLGVKLDPSSEDSSSDLQGSPAGLRRKKGGVFYRFKRGIYLPVGYQPKDPKDLVGSWPRTLVRQDGVTFIRFSGNSYRRGDFTLHEQPTPDRKGNPCEPHLVELWGFYIQDAEVTNREISEFDPDHPDAGLGTWKEKVKEMIDNFKKTPDELTKFPAVFINRATAQKFAESKGGRLPTEAEWEYVARSGGQNSLWARTNPIANKNVPKAHLFSVENAGEPLPVAVKTFVNEDETDQKIFDMTGNVREWCLDVYRPYSEIIAQNNNTDPARASSSIRNPREGGEPDPDGPEREYVVRGGSFDTDRDVAKTFQRDGVSAKAEMYDLGFRIVVQCPPEVVGGE
jgi:serine/threonine protein kinase/formylglycine-generating enzyme required for sulfatase activity